MKTHNKQNVRLLFVLSIIITAFFASNLYGQEWMKIEPVFDSAGVYDLSKGVFVDKNNGWIAEFYPARIWYTTDGGYNWNKQKEFKDTWIHDIKFINDSTGWAAAETTFTQSRFLLKTTNSGKNWEVISDESFFRIFFLDSLVGFGMDDKTLKTIDGGKTWYEINIIFSTPDIISLRNITTVKNSSVLWAVGSRNDLSHGGAILKSTDSGENWSVEHPNTVDLERIYFANDNFGCAVGLNGEVIITRDGGKTWETIYIYLTDIYLINESVGWGVGANGLILKTIDGFETWVTYEPVVQEDLSRIFFINNSVGIIFGKNNTLLKYDSSTKINENNNIISSDFYLFPNYPNPFNPQTTIEYQLKKSTNISLKVYDILGNEISTMESGNKLAGRYKIVWDGKNEGGNYVSSGVYIAVLKTEKVQKQQLMLLIK